MSCTKLPGRRNRVERLDTAGGPMIRKRFTDAACAERETAVYRLLEGSSLPHAALLEANADTLLLEALPGISFSVLLERQEAKSETALEPWEKLFSWVSSLCRLTGLAPTDCNLQNFLYDEALDVVYGIDFEECRPGRSSEALARLCAHILLHRPEKTVFKRELVAALCQQSVDAPTYDQIMEETEKLRLRRALRRNSRFSAAVLAGGKSSRMGRDKAALPFNGSTLLAYQIQKLRALGIEDIMVSGSSLYVSGVRPVPDIYPGHGPLSGIHACLAEALCQAVLFLSVDTPLIPPDALQLLLDAHVNGATLLCHNGQTEPLLGVYDRSLSGLCEPILQSGHTKVWRLLDQVEARLVPFDADESAFLNCNTPQEYNMITQIKPPFEA